MNKEQLNSMTVAQLRALDILDKADEVLVQQIINQKLMENPPLDPNRYQLSPEETDGMTPEKEKELQAKLDEMNGQTIDSPSVPSAWTEPEIVVETKLEPIVKKPFCDKCTSKGVRHKKGCPNKTF